METLRGKLYDLYAKGRTARDWDDTKGARWFMAAPHTYARGHGISRGIGFRTDGP